MCRHGNEGHGRDARGRSSAGEVIGRRGRRVVIRTERVLREGATGSRDHGESQKDARYICAGSPKETARLDRASGRVEYSCRHGECDQWREAWEVERRTARPKPSRLPAVSVRAVRRYATQPGRSIGLSRVSQIRRPGWERKSDAATELRLTLAHDCALAKRPPAHDAKTLDSHAAIRGAHDDARSPHGSARPGEESDPRPRRRAPAKALERRSEEGAAETAAHLAAVYLSGEENARRRDEDVAGHGGNSAGARTRLRLEPERYEVRVPFVAQFPRKDDLQLR